MTQTLLTIDRAVGTSSVDRIQFHVAEQIPRKVVDDFADWLVDHLKGGSPIADGDPIQYGFTTFRSCLNSGVLSLLAPDFLQSPINWITDLSVGFNISLRQKFTADSYALEVDPPSLRQYAIVGPHWTKPPTVIDRAPPSQDDENDSGWFVGSYADGVDNLQSENLTVVSIYEVAVHLPWVVDFLGLPVGTKIAFSENRPQCWVNGESSPVIPGSYLDKKLKRQPRSPGRA